MIKELGIDPNMWYLWAKTVLEEKDSFIMPAKTSLHFGESYFNTMPSILPSEGVMGVKVVNRYLDRIPSLDSQILLYDYYTGENLALMDGNLITAMRTGAAAVHAIEVFANKDFYEIGLMGMGNIGRAFLSVFLAHFYERKVRIKLLKYKNHADEMIEKYSYMKNVDFVIVDTVEELVKSSDVVVSCITYTDKILANEEWFKDGCVLLPVHLRGFQNCDLVFDKVFGDYREQVKGFQYFDRFKYFAETSEVLKGTREGRKSRDERILIYYVGMSVHDIYAASQIYKCFQKNCKMESLSPKEKYWI